MKDLYYIWQEALLKHRNRMWEHQWSLLFEHKMKRVRFK